jgi:hypothetical protein
MPKHRGILVKAAILHLIKHWKIPHAEDAEAQRASGDQYAKLSGIAG